jgi:hypothetical protein
MPRPATVLITGDQASIIRQREEEADVLRRDLIPDHLNSRLRRDEELQPVD